MYSIGGKRAKGGIPYYIYEYSRYSIIRPRDSTLKLAQLAIWTYNDVPPQTGWKHFHDLLRFVWLYPPLQVDLVGCERLG